MSRLILGITGHIASGKTDATAYLQDSHGAVCFRFSTMLRDILERIHIEESREHLQILSTSLRSLFGDDLMSKVIAKDVAQADADIIVVEGIRRHSDVAYLKNLPGFHLIAIEADMRTRYERIVGRSENQDDHTKTFEAFTADHERETEITITDTMKEAEYVINNNGDITALHAQIDAIIQQFTA